MVALQFTFIRFMFEGVQRWTQIVTYFIELSLGTRQLKLIGEISLILNGMSYVQGNFLTSWQSMLDFVL